jgi:hypothetical protein
MPNSAAISPAIPLQFLCKARKIPLLRARPYQSHVFDLTSLLDVGKAYLRDPDAFFPC